MPRFVLRVTILLFLASALAGCAGTEESPVTAPAALEPSAVVPAPPAEAVEADAPAAQRFRVPAGFRARRVPEAGAQVAVPRGWVALTRLDAVHPGARETLGAIDRRVAGPLAALGVPDSPLKLLVLAPVREGRFPATVTLVVVDAGHERTFQAFARRATAALIGRARPHGEVSARNVTLPVGRAVRLRYRGTSGGASSASVAYLALGGGQVYYLALTSQRHEAGFTRAFDTLARSLTRTPGSGGVMHLVGPRGTA